MTPIERFEILTGRWGGTCRTWFEPGKLADESAVSGTIVAVLDGRFLRHAYKGSINGKPRSGEELLAFNGATNTFQTSWVDSFHMSDAILFSQGEPFDRGFDVFGEYEVGDNQPKWGWRTQYQLVDEDRLIITAYNVTPDGIEAKAVETTYRRLPSSSVQ